MITQLGFWSKRMECDQDLVNQEFFNDNVDDHNIVERKTIEAKDQLLKNWNSMCAYCSARLSVTQDGKDGEG